MIRVSVKNTGKRTGDEVMQVYVSVPGSEVERHIRELKGFQRLTLNPGEQKTSEIHIPFEELRYYDEASRTWILEHTEYVFQAGSCADPAKLISVSCTL